MREPHGFSRLFHDGSWFPASIPSNPGSKVTSSDTRSRIQCVSEEQRSGLNGGWLTIVDRFFFKKIKHQTCGDIPSGNLTQLLKMMIYSGFSH